ncbi:MAG: exodeoxyribonuclease VII small subunit [Defluviitaleaceae bacterium]|nr:exodeoxyribonuclease VII small subunit [Defluviitaleaceae bacterium]
MPAKTKKTITFEEKLQNLAEIIEQVEDSETSLDSAIALYKEGIALAQDCGDTLRKYEEEVLTLQKTAEGFTLEPFATAVVS